MGVNDNEKEDTGAGAINAPSPGGAGEFGAKTVLRKNEARGEHLGGARRFRRNEDCAI